MTDTSYDTDETNQLIHRVMLEAFASSRNWITAAQLQSLLLSDPLVSAELSRIAKALAVTPEKAAAHIRGHWNQRFTRELAGHAKFPPQWTLLWARRGSPDAYEFYPLDSGTPLPPDDPTVTDEDRRESARAKISGPGPLTAAQRLAIEHRAYAVAREWIEEKGWTVIEEPRPGRPYDFGCRDDAGLRRKVEVKGTCTAGGAVMITRREEELARAEDIVLIVVSNLAVDGEAHANEKVTVFNPWVIEPGSTETVSLRWTLPSGS